MSKKKTRSGMTIESQVDMSGSMVTIPFDLNALTLLQDKKCTIRIVWPTPDNLDMTIIFEVSPNDSLR